MRKEDSPIFVKQETNGHGTSQLSSCPMPCFTPCRIAIFSGYNVKGEVDYCYWRHGIHSLVTEDCLGQQLSLRCLIQHGHRIFQIYSTPLLIFFVFGGNYVLYTARKKKHRSRGMSTRVTACEGK